MVQTRSMLKHGVRSNSKYLLSHEEILFQYFISVILDNGGKIRKEIIFLRNFQHKVF